MVANMWPYVQYGIADDFLSGYAKKLKRAINLRIPMKPLLAASPNRICTLF